MVVRFRWKPGEWRELYLLVASDQTGAGRISPAYLLATSLALFGAGDLLHASRGSREAVLHDRLLPALLLIGALALLTAVTVTMFRRHTRLRGLPAVPPEEQQVTLNELGWASSGRVGTAAVHRWPELTGMRASRGVIALLTGDGIAVGLPLRALSFDQKGWVERLLLRKVPRLAEGVSRRQHVRPSAALECPNEEIVTLWRPRFRRCTGS